MVAKEAHVVVQLATKNAQMATKDAMYETRFRQFEAMMQSRSMSEVTQHRDVPDTMSPARLMVISSVGSGSGNAIFSFIYIVLIIIGIWNYIAILVKICYILVGLVIHLFAFSIVFPLDFG